MNNDDTLKSIDGLINCVQGLQKTVEAILKKIEALETDEVFVRNRIVMRPLDDSGYK